MPTILGSRVADVSANRRRIAGLFCASVHGPLPTVQCVNIPLPRVNAAGALAAVLVLLASTPATAQLAPAALGDALALASQAAAATAPPGARVLVQPGSLDPRLTLAPCGRVEPYLPAGVPNWGKTRIGLRCSDGVTRWNVFLPVTVQVLAPALVSTVALPAGARLATTQLVAAEVDWAAASQPPFNDAAALAGRTLTRAVAAGQPLRTTDLLPRQWFAQGDTVQVVASGGGFAIATEGRALTPGFEGQPARVRMGNDSNDGGGRIVVGRPVAAHRVEVNL